MNNKTSDTVDRETLKQTALPPNLAQALSYKLAYSPEEVAIILGLCRDSVYRLLRRGLLRSSSALRHKIIPHAELERFLKSTLS
jgi:DNA-directed RNA polymerase specialized sigma24 family protein